VTRLPIDTTPPIRAYGADRGGVGPTVPVPEVTRAAVRKGLRPMTRGYPSRNGFCLFVLECLTPHARRIGMSTSEERALVTEIEDRLIELYVQQDEAKRAENRDRARELEIEIRG